MKRRMYIVAAVVCAAALSLVSCNKNCVCTGYDGGEYTYTSDEVDAAGVSCSNMIYQAQTRYYSYCEWK